MIDKLFLLLGQYPLVSIIGGFIMAIIAMFLFQEQIKDIIKKKFNLYTKQEAIVALTEVMYSKEVKSQEFEMSRNLDTKQKILTDDIINKFSQKLK